MITTILWDVDATLLDFLAAEKAAIKKLFQEFDLGECTDEMIRRYSKINRSYWEQLECGELTKPEVLVGRFREFFETEGICSDVAEAFNERYQLCLGDTIVFRDDSYKIVKSLRGKVKQYVVSNGTVVAQEKKLRLSGLGELMDGIFLSEALGVEKPNVEFFERMFEIIGPVEKDQVLIVQSKSRELSKYMAETLDEDWKQTRGMEIQAVAIASLSYDDKSQELLNMRNQGAMLQDPSIREGYMQGAFARGMEAAGSNANGSTMGFMGMQMGAQMGGNMAASMSAANQQQMIRNQQMQQEAATVHRAQNEPDIWICSCGQQNTGKFCSECGGGEPKNHV